MKSHAQESTVFKPGDISDLEALIFRICFSNRDGTAEMLQMAIERPALMARVVDTATINGSLSLPLILNLNVQPCDYDHGSLGQLHEFMSAYGRAGGNINGIRFLTVSWSAMDRLITILRTATATKLAEFVPPIPVDDKIIKVFTVSNSFGVSDAAGCFGIHPHDPVFRVFEQLPNGWENYRDTHYLIADLGFSIYELWQRYSALFGDTRYWLHAGQPTTAGVTKAFALHNGTVGWKLVRKTAIPDTFGLPWSDQLDQKKGGEVPSARLIVYTMVAMSAYCGIEPFKNCLLRCIDPLPKEEDNSIVVGHHPILIDHYPDRSQREDIGLAGAVVPESEGPAEVTPVHARECARASARQFDILSQA